MATYQLSDKLGASADIGVSVSGYGATTDDYGSLFFRTGNATSSVGTDWKLVIGGKVTLPKDTNNFQLKVDVKKDSLTEIGESVAFVVAQTTSDGAFKDSWYVADVIQLTDAVTLTGVVT